MRSANVRCGVTLVEVLVLTGIVVVLLALALPAIQRVREVANAVRCTSNLRAIGLAFAEMTAGNRPFPMGGASDPEADKSWEFHFNPTGPELPATGLRQNWGWAYQILPHLGYREQWAARDVFAEGDPIPVPSGARTVKEYFCPSRARANLVQRPIGAYAFAAADYAGNGGPLTFVDPSTGKHHTNRFATYLPPFTATSLPHWGVIGASVSHRHGSIRIDPQLRPSDIEDGLSNTLLIGEKRVNLFLMGDGAIAQPQPGDRLGFCSGFGTDTVRSAAFPMARDKYSSDEIVPDGFGSSHPSGINMLFADGSVRRLKFELGAADGPRLGSLLQKLAHRRDGEMVSSISLE